MGRRAGKILIIFSLVCAVGLQWLGLQSVAWASMLVQHARQQSLRQAISQTFDGAHPCSLCHLVQKGKASEKKPERRAAGPKIDLLLSAGASLPEVSLVACFSPRQTYSLGEFVQAPLAPPPRLS